MRQFGAALLLLAACASQPPRADAEAAISAWVQAKYGEGLRSQQIFLGDFTGDGAPDALVWVMYNDGGLHNFGEGALFRSQHGRMIYWRGDDTASGEDPRDVVFASGRITLTTTILQDGDARCCPTGSQNWTIETK